MAAAGCGSASYLSRSGRWCGGGCARDLLCLLFVRDDVAFSPASLGRGRLVCRSYGRCPLGTSGGLDGDVARAGCLDGGRRIRLFSSTSSAGEAGSGGRRRARGRPPTRAPQRKVGTSVLFLVVHKAVFGDGASPPSVRWSPLLLLPVFVAGDEWRASGGDAELFQGLGCNSGVLWGLLCILHGSTGLSGPFSLLCTCIVLSLYLV